SAIRLGLGVVRWSTVPSTAPPLPGIASPPVASLRSGSEGSRTVPPEPRSALPAQRPAPPDGPPPAPCHSLPRRAVSTTAQWLAAGGAAARERSPRPRGPARHLRRPVPSSA